MTAARRWLLNLSPSFTGRGRRVAPGEGQGSELNTHAVFADRRAPHPNPLPAKGGEREKKSQSQHGLGDDVALDLVGAAVDRDLAVVEIARRDLRGPVHRFVGAL